ncbi:MAG: hypothetical protein ACI4BD_08315 [Paludibacteraceae bacterium]
MFRYRIVVFLMIMVQDPPRPSLQREGGKKPTGDGQPTCKTLPVPPYKGRGKETYGRWTDDLQDPPRPSLQREGERIYRSGERTHDRSADDLR